MEISGMIKAVKETAIKHSMFNLGDAILAGVSGGADSIALVHILLKLSPEFNLSLGIAHFDHELRAAESERDAEFVSSFAHKMNLPFYSEKADVKKYSSQHKLSIEEAGRILRYQFLSRTAREHGFNKIALGHQKEDTAETFLINILRGSGPQGLSSIPPKRGIFIRPLINLNRSDIECFIRSESMEHIIDSSNMDPKFLRNRIRHYLIPFLASEYNPEIVEILNRTAEILRDEQIWLDSLTGKLFERTRVQSDDANIRLSIPELLKMPIAAARRIIRKSVLEIKGNLNGVGFTHMDAVFELINNNKCEKELDFPGPVRIKREKDILVIIRRKNRGRVKRQPDHFDRQLCAFEYRIMGPQTLYIKETDQCIQLSELSSTEILELKKSNFQNVNPREAYMDMASIGYPLVVRSFRSGDHFSPLGLSGFQKLKKFFINNKLPSSERKKIPILEFSEKIVWVAGYRIDDSVKVTPLTQKVLKASLLKASA